MECSGWCVTNETLTHILLAYGLILAILVIWVWVLDGRVEQQHRYIERTKKLGRFPIEGKPHGE